MHTWLRRNTSFVLVPVYLATSLVLPSLVILVHRILPNSVQMLLFFCPQYFFSFSYVVRSVPGGFHPLFQTPIAHVFGLAIWVLASLGFGFVARRWRLRYQLLAAPLAIALVTILIHTTFYLLGYALQLDGL